MVLLSSAAGALLGVLLAITSSHSAYAHEARGLRGLMNDNEVAHKSCGVRASTPDEVRAFNDMVDQFYREAQTSPAGNRRLQETINVVVNFLNVKSSAGLGATDADLQAQMDVLNAAFRPDFVFNLNASQVVTNDVYFGTIDSDTLGGPVEMEMKTQYRQGGLETLNIYSVNVLTNGRTTSGWSMFSTGNIPADGVVMDYQTVPNGGGSSYKGFVSTDSDSSDRLHLVFPKSFHSLLCSFSLFRQPQTLVHEVGHWLGLDHTFNGWDETAPSGGCVPPGDGIADTPAEAKPHFDCDDPARDSCPNDPGVDPMYNFMSYSPDKCLKEFTAGQLAAMRAFWFTHRAPKAAEV
jgi:Pregnancy-associated plasma protein-A